MQYPKRLLPKQNYKLVEDISLIRNRYLIHYTDNKDLRDPVSGKLKITSVARQTDHLRDYSNNLLGEFEVNDIYLQISKDSSKKEYFLDLWNKGTNVEIPLFEDDFIVNDTRGFFFMPVKLLEGKEVVYTDKTEVKSYCKILHTPTNSNFWHFSLRWFHNGEDIIYWKENVRRRILTHAKSLIIEIASFNEPVYEGVDDFLYKEAI